MDLNVHWQTKWIRFKVRLKRAKTNHAGDAGGGNSCLGLGTVAKVLSVFYCHLVHWLSSFY